MNDSEIEKLHKQKDLLRRMDKPMVIGLFAVGLLISVIVLISRGK